MSYDWSPEPPDWSPDQLTLLPHTSPPSPVTLATILDKSASFSLKFPINSNRCVTLKSSIGDETLERNANSAYPVVHENVLHLYARYIIHKRKHGNTVEKTIYRDMNLVEFVDRLLTKRAATFMGKHDVYVLLDGSKGQSMWESIGTVKEKEPLVLKKCLSYEEVKLSAFLSVSSFTYFVNLGDRKNKGVPQVDIHCKICVKQYFRSYVPQRTGVEDEGVIVGVVGPRLVKPRVMEYQELVASQPQNQKKNGYGNVQPPTIHHFFADFYQQQCTTYDDILKVQRENPQRFTDLQNGELIDNLAYYKRLLFTIDLLLLESNQRASNKGTTAYLHVVGIGLGVWKKSPCQNKLFMEAFGKRILDLGSRLTSISDICFAYIDHDSCLGHKNGDTMKVEGHPGIKIHVCNREPHSKLKGVDAGKLLIVSYAWDGNALPGNEFWVGKLGSSGDSAAASSTQIAELHNPFINPMVCADNLRVVVADGVVGVGEYAQMLGRAKRPLEVGEGSSASKK